MKPTKRKSGSIERRLANFILSSQPTVIIAIEIIAATLSNLFLLFFFLDLTTDLKSIALVNLDVMISQFIYTFRTPWLTSTMIIVSAFGANFILAAATLIFIIALLKRHNKEAVLFAITLLMGLLLNNALKLVAARPRPDLSPLVIERTYSFPSGHAMNSFIFYGLIAYFSYHFWHKRQLTLVITAVCVVMVGLIGFSRVYLGVHYPSDILAGYVAGLWWLIMIILVEKTLIFYRLFRRSE